MSDDEHERDRRRRRSSTSVARSPSSQQNSADAACAPVTTALRQQVERHVDAPRLLVRHVVVDARRRRAATDPASAIRAAAGAPGLPCNMNGRVAISGRIDALVGAEVEDFRPRAFLGLADRERLVLRRCARPRSSDRRGRRRCGIRSGRRSRTPAAAGSRRGSRRSCTSRRCACSDR